MKTQQSDGSVKDEVSNIGKTQDMGQVLTGSSVAAGATAYGDWVDGVDWVRNIVFLAQSDQNYDLVHQVRDKDGTTSLEASFVTGQSATAGGTSWRKHVQAMSSGNSGILGYSARFGMKNSGATPSNVKLRVQLLGL